MKTTLCLLTLSALPAWAAVDFAHQVVPLLRKHCAECHTGDKKKGGFSMNDRAALLEGSENGAVVDLKRPHQSALLEVIRSDDEDVRMPPKGAGLTKDEITLLQQWLEEGMSWESGFAFKKPAYEPPLKPRQVSLPPVVAGRSNPVDRLLDQYLAEHKLPRPAPLTDAAFLRRASLDLIGLLPTPEELAAFQAEQGVDKRERLIHRLLSRDVDYAEHWLTFWNDLLRNYYGGTGFITGGRKQISKWLYDALVSNKPFDQFTRELIAPPTDESRGFIDGIKWRGEVSAGQTVEIQFAQSVGQSFLGINLKCASCHDSFVDRWKLDEAYGLAAIYSERPLEISRCDKPVGRQAQASWLFPELGQVEASAPRAERLKQLAALMTHPENGRFTRTMVNRLWQRLMGRGLVHPLDAMQSPPWDADLLDYLASDLQANGYDLKQTLTLIATSQIYQSQGEIEEPGTKDGAYVFKAVRAKRLTAEQFMDGVWRLTGAAPDKMDASVFRGKADPELAKQIHLQGKWIWGDSAKPGKVPPAGETILMRKLLKLDQAVVE
ncbi:MAG: PSD1 and planctomycete cytochrome C domain-containing protein, partial [Prosthecobacter sp.]|nr:PSD1 and planctomycete cytochrome C domain-containing protein [Prosthecobacter sp.]